MMSNNTLHFKSHPLILGRRSFLSLPVVETNISFLSLNLALKSPFFRSSLSVLGQVRIQEPIFYAKRSKRRSGFRVSEKLTLQLISIFASGLNILPPPLDLVIGEFNNGDVAGQGFLKGLGAGGLRGWKRIKKGNLGFLFFGVIFGLLISFSGKEFNVDLFCGVLGLAFFLIALIKGFKMRNIKGWIFGLCCFAIFMGLGLKRGDAMKWVNEIRVWSPIVEIVSRGKRKGRRRGF